MDMIDEILDLVKKKMYEQAAYDRDAYKEIVEETIRFFQERGNITDDDDTELLEDQLMEMWPSVEGEFIEKRHK